MREHLPIIYLLEFNSEQLRVLHKQLFNLL